MTSIKSVLALAGLLAFLSASHVMAGEVKVTGVHLCCAGCVKAAEKALTDVEGVSGPKVDKDEETVTFQAADDKAAAAGVAKLAEAGLGGAAKHGDKNVRFPNPGIKREDRDKTVETLTFKGVHLCCQGCIDVADAAMKEVKGVEAVAIDKEEGTVKLTGKEIKPREAYRALLKAGLYGKVAS